MVGESTSFRINATVGADLVAYANGTQPSRAYPLIVATQQATFVPRLLFLESSVSVRAAERDPFAARSAAGTTENRQTTAAYRVSPYIDYQISPASSAFARYDESWSNTDAVDAADQHFTNVEVRLSRRPLPFGGSVEYTKQIVRFSGHGESRATFDTVKAKGDIAIGGELIVGPVLGRERSTLFLETTDDNLYGAHLQWTPSERTRLTAEAARRFFGTGWTLDAQHRLPWMTISLQWNRSPITTATSLGVAAAGSNLNTFLDGILTTRYPDPAARAVVVTNLIANRGLPTSVQGPIDVQAAYAQLQNNLRATWVLLGSRNIISVTTYAQTLRLLTRAGAAPTLLAGNLDNRQVGVTLGLNRRLSPQLTLDASANWSRINGLADQSGDVSREQIYRVAIVRAVSPRAGISAGLQHDRLATTLPGIDSFKATSAFVGVNHRF